MKNHKLRRAMDLTSAIDEFLEQGGTINLVSEGATAVPIPDLEDTALTEQDHEREQAKKSELLRELVAKGAGISALQYSLRMNKREIRRLAQENGLKIAYSRPIHTMRKNKVHHHSNSSDLIDDSVAGHAMHYSALGYTAFEIAQKLELSICQVWKLAKDYRFELKQDREN